MYYDNEYINRVHIRGRLGDDPKIFDNTYKSGEFYSFLNVATTVRYVSKPSFGDPKDEKLTTWHSAFVEGKSNIDTLREFGIKGALIDIVGVLERVKDKKNPEIWVARIRVTPSRGGSVAICRTSTPKDSVDANSRRAEVNKVSTEDTVSFNVDGVDDDIPF